jgi:hypothetical protein
MKKTIVTIIQVVVTVGLLCWVLRDPAQRAEMGKALSQAVQSPTGRLWLLGGFACYGIVEILAALRWYLLLRVQGVKLPLIRLVALFMLGIFFNMFMPGGTGGDVLKIYFLIKEIPDKKKEGLLAVLMDRLIGLLGLIIVSAVIIGLRYDWLKQAEYARHATWLLMLILFAGLGAITFSFLISGFRLASKLPAKIPMRDKLIDVSDAYNIYAKSWPISLVAMCGSFGVHIFSFSVYVCAARALNIHVSVKDMLTVMPIILSICSLPISVGGNGVRELLFANLLTPLCGVAAPMAKALSLTGFMLTGAWGAIGGIIYLLYRPSQHAKMRDVAREVHDLEHEVAATEEAEEEAGKR